jgi:hypothetical protein
MVLRVIAMFLGVNAVWLTVIGVYALVLAVEHGLPPVGRDRLVYVVLGPLGVFGSIQLLRLHETGRRVSLAFMGVTFLLSLTKGLGSATASDLTIGALLAYALEIGCFFLLLSEGARKACGETAPRPSRSEGIAGFSSATPRRSGGAEDAAQQGVEADEAR